MRRCVVGVIGHVDHGKTALVRALTGIETDRLPEERRRGISIALGFAHLVIGDAVVDFIDMPGHERFVRTMVSGATGIDAALLVVAANEGIKPQTVEHAEIAGLLGLRHAILVIGKCDLVSEPEARAVAEAATLLLRRVGLAPSPPVFVSVVTGSGLDDLREALVTAMRRVPARGSTGLAFLPIDRAFSVAGHGTVVTGTLRGDAVAPGDTLELWPGARPLRVRGVQVHGAKAARAIPGQRVALNMRDASATELHPGTVLAAPGTLTQTSWLTLTLRAVADAPTLANAARLRALLGTAEIGVRLRLLDRDQLEPGQTCLAQLHTDEQVAIPAREKLILRLPSPAQTVAGGTVIDADASRLKRHDSTVLTWLEHLAGLDAAAITTAGCAHAGMAGTSVARLSRLSALPQARVVSLLEAVAVLGRDGMVVSRDALDQAVARVRALLAQAPHTREQLARALPTVGRPVLDEALSRLLTSGAFAENQGLIVERRVDAEHQRAQREATLRAELIETLRRGGLTPTDPAPTPDHKRVLDRLIREGIVIRAPDPAQNRVVLFHQEAVAEARRRLRPLLAQPPGLLVSEVGVALGISRKFSVPLLEHLDQTRFTRRIQDRRILGETAQAALSDDSVIGG